MEEGLSEGTTGSEPSFSRTEPWMKDLMGSRYVAEPTEEERSLPSLLDDWAAWGFSGARAGGVSSWLSCDKRDEERVLFHEEKPKTGDDIAHQEEGGGQAGEEGRDARSSVSRANFGARNQ